MAFSKSYLFDPSDQMICQFTKALTHPARLDILRVLAKTGPSSVENLALRYPLAKSTLSQHLEALREAGLVHFREEYPRTYYSLDAANFKKLKKMLIQYFRKMRE